MNTNQIMVKMVLDRWNASLKNWDGLLTDLSDEALQKEIAPGRNTGIYLLGHMIAVHDDMLILMDMGEKLYPELHKAFLELPDKSVVEIPSAKELREKWSNQCQ